MTEPNSPVYNNKEITSTQRHTNSKKNVFVGSQANLDHKDL